MKPVDLKLETLSDGTFDLIEGDTGDLEATEGFDTDLYLSILTDARASETEASQAKDRSGWLGDLVPVVEGIVLGSLLWTYQIRKLTSESKNGARDAVEKSLQWMVDLGYAKSIDVSAEIISVSQGALITVVITAFSGETDTINVPIWKATVNGY